MLPEHPGRGSFFVSFPCIYRLIAGPIALRFNTRQAGLHTWEEHKRRSLRTSQTSIRACSRDDTRRPIQLVRCFADQGFSVDVCRRWLLASRCHYQDCLVVKDTSR